MVTKTQARRKQDIKSKLMAAIAMLLVSSIMMVSSTYAWFTLSTAPEVTGISTAVGANGNLEMALMPTDGLTKGVLEDFGIEYGVDNSMATQAVNLANITWGNLVDLSDSTFYGLDKITLFPAALNVTGTGAIAESMLSYPLYGADGRVSDLKEDGIVTSTYDSQNRNFPQNENHGVRAVGAASGMTDRQLAYRSARAAASTNMELAKVKAAQSLTDNGGALANIVAAKAMSSEENYKEADVNALKAVVNSLLGTNADATDGVLEYIEEAYRSYIIAFGASQASVTAGMDDTEFNAFKTAIENATDVYAAVTVCSTHDITLPTEITTPLGALEDTRGNVVTAQGKLNDITKTEGITWAELNTALIYLADVDAMMINGKTAEEIKADMGTFANDAINNGLVVSMATGGGVYADVADHCGDYVAEITIKELSISGFTVNNYKASMKTASTVDPSYLATLGSAVNTAGAPVNAAQGGQTMPISDMYGYIVDLAFKTNAANSNLLLQTAAVDRIYENQQQGVTEGNLTTMGHGSTMTFTTADNNFTVDQMKNLMESIRLVFFKTDDRMVLAKAKLDMDDATTTGRDVTANIYLYQDTAASVRYDKVEGEAVEGTTYYSYTPAQYTEATPVAGDGKTYYTLSGEDYIVAEDTTAAGTYYILEAEKYDEISDIGAHTGDKYVKVDVAAGESLIKTPADAVITALTQNTAQAVSVLVYLDGETVTNADVSATGTTSMTGSLNLQFASSANLVPMEYTPLMEQTGTTTGGDTTGGTTTGGETTDEGEGTT